MSESAHNVLKKYLLDLGKSAKDSKGNPYYEVYSGDSEPVDIRLKKRHFDYPPDIIWKRRGRFIIIELAFTEDWRSIVGELTLAFLTKNCSRFILITANWDSDLLGNIVGLVGDSLRQKWNWINLDQSQLDDIEKAKKFIRTTLKHWEWI